MASFFVKLSPVIPSPLYQLNADPPGGKERGER